MKRIAPIIVGIVICVLVAAGSYYWATGLMDSVYTYRSPLHNSAPIPGDAIGKPITRSLVVVLIDALRYDTSLKVDVMPYLNHLRSVGASALMHSRPPSYSEPAYSVLLTGAWPDISDGPAMNLDYAEIPAFTQDDVFSAAHRAGLQTAISGFNWFEKLVPQSAVTSSFYTPGEDQVADRLVTDAAMPWIQDSNYQLVLIHLDQVDYAGHHEGGPLDPRWDEAATRADRLLEEIATSMNLTKDTLLVISDHGQIDTGGHGGQDPIVLMEPFVLVGKGIIPGEYSDVQMVDVAPTIAAILGTNIPATNQGHPQIAMLDIPLTEVDHINQVLSTQQSKLVLAYQIAVNHSIVDKSSSDAVVSAQSGINGARESILNSQRVPRGIIAVIIGFFLLTLAAWYSKPYYRWMLLGVFSYLLVFNIKYILIDHKTYSLSSVTNATSLIASTALTTLLALFVGWIIVILGTKVYQLKPRKAVDLSFKFIFVALSIISIPILVHYVINGAIVTWMLPNYLFSFLGLIFLIQALMVAVIGLFLTAISPLLGYFARGR